MPLETPGLRAAFQPPLDEGPAAFHALKMRLGIAAAHFHRFGIRRDGDVDADHEGPVVAIDHRPLDGQVDDGVFRPIGLDLRRGFADQKEVEAVDVRHGALILASLGIYGLISYAVTQRTQEIAIRMALGASAGDVQLRVVLQTLGLAAIGIAIGTSASWGLARLLQSFLFGVTASDPLTFAAMIAVLALVAVIAGYVPGRRASRIDPMSALRAN